MKTLSYAVLAAVLAGCAFLPMDPPVGGKALVVIGSYYASIPDSSLRVTAMDGMEMAVLLKNQGYEVSLLVDQGDIPQYWSDPAPARVAEHIRSYYNGTFLNHFTPPFPAADRTNILESLKSIRESLHPGENFFFFYAGHSGNLNLPGAEDSWSVQGNNEAMQLPNWDFSYSQDTYLSDDDMAAELEKFPPDNPKILIFDSCRSGGFIGQDGTIPLTGTTEAKDSLKIYGPGTELFGSSDIIPSKGLVLSAAPEMLDSQGDGDYGDDDLRFDLFHGFFTFTLLEGVSTGWADQDRNGLITATELYTYSRSTMGRWRTSTGPWVSYRPRISGGSYDIILFKTGR